MLFVQPSRLASRQPVLRDSLGFPNRMYERCWRRMNRSGEVDGVRFLARSGGTPCMRLFTATRARRSTRRPRQSVSKLRDVVAGVLPCVAAPLELLYATSRNGKISPPVVIFSLTWSRRETRRETRSSSYISGSTKYDRRAYRSSTQTFRGQSAHYCIERISSRSWNDDSILSSSS
jgi:hypothetical protein